MIRVFGAGENVFDNNGDKILNPLKAVITKEDNGDYSLALETSINDKDYIEHGNIIVCDTPWGKQGFRVYNPQKKNNKITCTCKHLYFDAENYLIADNYVVDRNCNYALDWFNSNTEPASPFTTLSDIDELGTLRVVRKSLSEAIGEIINVWGGHLVRDNFKIEIRNHIGQDNGVVIRYGKNLQDITAKEDWSKVVTKLLPVGKDGLLLPELYITTSDIDTSSPYYQLEYEIPYCKTVSFTQDLEKTDEETDEQYQEELIEDLRTQAIAYITENCVPKISYTVKANVENVTDVGDLIEVIDERFLPSNQTIPTYVISLKYDCLQERFTEVNFGTPAEKLKNLISNVTTSATNSAQQAVSSDVTQQVESSLAEAYEKIWSALGSSYVIYESDKILIVDALPKEEAQYCIMFNSAGISFSQNGINGEFISAWTIDGTFNAQAINIINLTADIIKGGTLKLGSDVQQHGVLEIFNEANRLIGRMDQNGLIMWANDESYIQINNEVGFAGFDKNGNKIYWVDGETFCTNKFIAKQEITVGGKLRMLPIQTNSNNGIGFVAIYEE